MVLVGGATRLTESGLSITQWKPVTGVVPPLNAAEWQAEFDRYKQIPQYARLNPDMTLDGFKSIFWWEWAHRLLARIVGAAFILPGLFFWWRGELKGGLGRQLAVATGLLALEPLVGWWMVTSGLSERTEVAPQRLALHLMIAAATFGALVYAAAGLGEPPKAKTAPRGFAISAWIFAALVFCQLGLGALVAGLRAGLIYNTWPLMGSGLVPSEAFRPSPWRAIFGDPATAQFDHRMIAYTIVTFALVQAAAALRLERVTVGSNCHREERSDAAIQGNLGRPTTAGLLRQSPSRRTGVSRRLVARNDDGGSTQMQSVSAGSPLASRAVVLAAVALIQVGLGIATLLALVPIELALAHQALALALFGLAMVHVRATEMERGAAENFTTKIIC